jgi:hypothetical protein
MKALHSIPILTLALVAGFSASAFAEPTPVQPAQQGQIMAGPGDGAAGPINQVNKPDGFSLSSSTPGSTVVAPQANSSAAGPGAGAAAPNSYLKIEGIDGESKVQASSDIGSTTRKKPSRNGTRGKRQHKP